MTNEELSVEFDILFSNIASNQAPGVNTYEKSVFLTKGQEEVLKNYFNPKGNRYIEGFDDSEKRQVDFSNIIVIKSLEAGSTNEPKIDTRSFLFTAPTDIMFSLNEKVIDTVTNKQYNVKPLSYKEYERLTDKPYPMPLKRQAWRLTHTTSAGNKLYEVVVNTPPNNTIAYTIRYVKVPRPIILESLTGDYQGLSINGETQKSTCELSESLHREILQRAVEIAKMTFELGSNGIIEAGTRTE